jgi:hypothetical protein
MYLLLNFLKFVGLSETGKKFGACRSHKKGCELYYSISIAQELIYVMISVG